LQELDLARSSLKEALKLLQDEQATSMCQLTDTQQSKLKLQAQLQKAEELAALRQVEVLKERQALEDELQVQRTKVDQLEQEVQQAQEQTAKITQEKEELVVQAAELQITLSDEKLRHQEAMAIVQQDQDRLDSNSWQ
jgi:hypothetical protein